MKPFEVVISCIYTDTLLSWQRQNIHFLKITKINGIQVSLFKYSYIMQFCIHKKREYLICPWILDIKTSHKYTLYKSKFWVLYLNMVTKGEDFARYKKQHRKTACLRLFSEIMLIAIGPSMMGLCKETQKNKKCTWLKTGQNFIKWKWHLKCKFS